MKDNPLADLVRAIVEKSGGVEKCEMLLKLLQGMKTDDARIKFVRRAGTNQDAANQLVAFTMLGLTMSVATVRGTETGPYPFNDHEG